MPASLLSRQPEHLRLVFLALLFPCPLLCEVVFVQERRNVGRNMAAFCRVRNVVSWVISPEGTSREGNKSLTRKKDTPTMRVVHRSFIN